VSLRFIERGVHSGAATGRSHNPPMRLRFTKMQGAGNDFVVLDATRAPLDLSADQLRLLGDRRFGVGADQILVVDPSDRPGVDFGYRIFNGGSGDEVEHCGNGARCFVRYVREHGLTERETIRVATVNKVLELRWRADGRVTVDMSRPVFDLAQVPFDARDLVPRELSGFALWPLNVSGMKVEVAVLSMGNPHAVQIVADVDAAPVETLGPRIEGQARFARRVNAGFMQIVDRGHIRLRVYERGAGETLACGTGACAAVVAGIRLGLLEPQVEVDARGGRLTIEWAGGQSHVLMTGPAETVFEGEIEL
jgi:diaminopimelate epimerase